MKRNYDRILLRKDDRGNLTLNGYYGNRRALLFDILYEVTFEDAGRIALKWTTDDPSDPATWPAASYGSWEEVSAWLMLIYGLPLYGMQRADQRVMDFLKGRETMMDRALMEYVLPKGQRKGFPPGVMNERAMREVESFQDWKNRKEYWEALQQKNITSPV